jgi:hypothetical protein
MVPLVRNPIGALDLVLAQCVAILEAVSRRVSNAIGGALGAGGQPQVGVRDFLEPGVLLDGSIVFDVADVFPRALVVITSTPLDEVLFKNVTNCPCASCTGGLSPAWRRRRQPEPHAP